MSKLTIDKFEVDGNIWIKKQNKSFMGRGRVELLQNIQIHGSITKAAKAMKMSYKAAWDSIDIMNKLSNKPVVTKVTGGKGGGGTVITAHAKELMHTFEEIASLNKKYFEILSNSFNEQVEDEIADEPVFSRLQGTLISKNNINENYEISIKLPSNQIITSIESKKFVEEKALNLDDEINFLIETNNIVLTKEPQDSSARNLLYGKVLKINDDGINANISMDCGEEDIIHAKITSSSCKKLNLQVEETIYAQFKAYNITIV
jgi:molybdate transport system regulatory protein